MCCQFAGSHPYAGVFFTGIVELFPSQNELMTVDIALLFIFILKGALAIVQQMRIYSNESQSIQNL